MITSQARRLSVSNRGVIAAIFLFLVFCLISVMSASQAFAGEGTESLKAGSIEVTSASTAKDAVPRGMVSSCVSRRAGSITVKAASVKGVFRYQFAIAADCHFRVARRIVSSQSDTNTFNFLDSGRKYYVSVRVCKNVAGKYVWGRWSKLKCEKAKVITLGFVSLHSSPSGSGVRWWKNCGFNIVGITSPNDPDLKRVYGVLVPGGKDMDPKYYGEKKHPKTVLENPKVDALKLAVTRKCAAIGKPLLGICGGEQVLNVALGGSLNQHIPTGYHHGWRKVKIAKGSWLYSMWGSTASVSHSHHQCVKRLGKGLIATQWDAKDGYIEAIEHVSLPLYGVQWHPENMGAKGRCVARSFARICMLYALK